MNIKTKASVFLRILVSLSLIALLFYLRRDSLGQTLEAIRRLRLPVFVLSCAVFVLSTLILALRLKVLLHAQGLLLSHSETMHLTFIGYFFNNFLPTAIGGDVVKGYYAFKKTGNKVRSFISIFMDRFIGFLSLFILAGTSLLFTYRYIKTRSLIWFTIAILAALLLALIFFFNKRFATLFSPLRRLAKRLNISGSMETLYNTINSFKNKKAILLQAFLLSITAQLAAFFVIYLLTKGMRSFISIKMVLLFMPLVSIVSMLPSINGLGIRESSIYFLFGPYIGYKNALALSLLWLFMLLLVGFVGGLCYLLGTRYKTRDVLKEGT